MNNYGYLGVVTNGKLNLLLSEDGSVGVFRLSGAAADTDDDPASEEILLTRFEGRALVVRGLARGRWIVAATIIEEAGLILTAVARVVLTEPLDADVKLSLFLTG